MDSSWSKAFFALIHLDVLCQVVWLIPLDACMSSLPSQRSSFLTSCEGVAAQLNRDGLSTSLKQAHAVRIEASRCMSSTYSW